MKPKKSPKVSRSTDGVTKLSAEQQQQQQQTADATFLRGVLVRGEAGVRDKDGNLAAGVTHEIVAPGNAHLPVIVRRRFSAA
jgi:hypothetical protein